MHCTHMNSNSPTSSHPLWPPSPSPPQPQRIGSPNAEQHKPTPNHHPPSHPNTLVEGNDGGGETPAWESCGRIVEQEREDFWEFIGCNALFASLSLFVMFVRSKRLRN